MKDICRVLEVSVSGYYRWVKRKNMPTRDELLSAAIKDVLDEDPWNDNYGVRRMQLALAQRGIRAGIRRLTRLMRENGWLHERKRRPKGLTTADPEAMKAENLINQDFSAEKPYQKLLTDITQVQCADGKLYISPILDCFNGEILSLCMANNMKKELIYRIPAYRMRMDEVRTLIFRYVFTYYNRLRVYTANPDGLPPEQLRDAALGLAA